MEMIEYKLLLKRQLLQDQMKALLKQDVIRLDAYTALYVELAVCNQLLIRCRRFYRRNA